MSKEIAEMFEQFILEWIQLNYHEAKQIQQERYPEKNERIIIHILFLSYNTNIVRYILKRLKGTGCHKNSMIQYIIHYNQTVLDIQCVDDILDRKNIDNMLYLIQYMVCVCVKTPSILTMILQTFDDLENEVVVLK